MHGRQLTFKGQVNKAAKNPPECNEHLAKGNGGPGPHSKQIGGHENNATAGGEDGHQDTGVHGVGDVCRDGHAQGVVGVVRTERFSDWAVHYRLKRCCVRASKCVPG